MTLDQLKSLQAIVEGGSLRVAAQNLNRTQPTISVAIKNLEDELGLKIFDRDQYRNKLTPQGKALYEKAKLVLGQAQSFKNLANQLATGEELEVGIAFTSAIPVSPIISTIRQCKVEFPGTRLEVYSENGMGPLDLLEDGRASILIIPWIENFEKLESMHFMNLRFKSVIAADSPLLQEYDVVPKAVMKKHPQVIISGRKSSNKTYGVLEGGDQWRVNDFQTKKEIIMQGMGWGSLPEHLIKDELEQRLLAPLKVEGNVESPGVELRIVRLESEPVGPVAQRLWQLFREGSN
ncbi:LysR family transcriptional regulator [Aliikangiella coralliicola]|uniref:LysR family transcriptional regulator n=1 Tax=Aliikangiella coralliicola TaxID=2592383 RepID=A0A545U5W7_9GAMM|nr:LysR family transcriptional regulator [Aliikangiella coralliicola]TQV84862.1 LysR family transcriptional regulator [Aliikangiella coralliicola]